MASTSTPIADERADRRDAAARRHRGVRTCADAASLIALEDLDAVVIATPLDTHYPFAKAAIERGKHVLVEKPLRRIASARRGAGRARATGTTCA